jgi:hypothetical protein
MNLPGFRLSAGVTEKFAKERLKIQRLDFFTFLFRVKIFLPFPALLFSIWTAGVELPPARCLRTKHQYAIDTY